MPYTVKNPPDRIKMLPTHAIEIWVAAFNSALDQYKDEEKANAVAWAAVKLKYKKVGDKWVAMSMFNFIYPIDVSKLVFVEGKDTTEIQVLPIGNWKHLDYGKIKMGLKEIIEFIKNFNSHVRKELPITEGHPVGGKELPAIGWFKELLNKGREGLWAVIEWTEKGRELIEGKSYKYFSPEYYTTYEDPETHEIYHNVLSGGALTNRPYFKELAMVLSEQTLLSMKIEDIIKKEPSELTDEETDFIKENKDELSDDDKEKFKSVLEEGKEGDGDKDKDKTDLDKVLEKDVSDLTDEDKSLLKEKQEDLSEDQKDTYEDILKEEGEGKEGSEKIVQMSELVVKTLERNARAGVKAFAILRKKDAEKLVDSFTFSEVNKSGPILLKSRDKVVEFLLSLNEKQKNEFEEILKSLPKGKLFSELGKDDGIPVETEDRVQQLVEGKMSKDDKLTYRQAMEQVFAENPELAKQAEEK